MFAGSWRHFGRCGKKKTTFSCSRTKSNHLMRLFSLFVCFLLLLIPCSPPEVLSPQHSCTLFKATWWHCSRPPLVASSPTNQKEPRSPVDMGSGCGRMERLMEARRRRADLQIAKQMYLRVLLYFPPPHTRTHTLTLPPPRLDPGTRQESPAFTVWWVCIEIYTCLGFMCLFLGVVGSLVWPQRGHIRPHNGPK